MEQKDKKQKFNVAKDENEEMSMKEYGSAKICNSKIDVEAKLKSMFVNSIPIDSIRELPSRYMYMMGILANVMLFGCFMFFVIQGISSGMKAKFISLDPNSGICSEVPRQVDGSFVATYDGHWIGSPAFVYNKAMYILTLSSFEANNEQYSEMMSYFGSLLQQLGEIASRSPLTFNLLLWMSMTLQYKMGDSIQKLQLMGNPSMVFSSDDFLGSVASSKGACSAPLSSSFDVSSSSLRMIFDTQVYKNESTCSSAIPMSFLSSVWEPGPSITVGLDTRALVTALAVNLGVLSIDALSPLNSTVHYYNGYNIIEMIDPRYPGMDIVSCYVPSDNSTAKAKCIIGAGNSQGIPVLNPAGSMLYFPSYCTCDEVETPYSNCDDFYLLPGVIIFYDSEDLYRTLLEVDMKEFNMQAYNATLVAALGMYGFYSDSYMKDSFSFCNDTCFVLSWLTMEYSNAVSEYYYQIIDGSCSDKITTPYWMNFQITPPVTLTETYFQCTDTWISSTISAIGIANGNTATLLPIGVLMILPLMYLYLKWIGYAPPKEEYSQDEKNIALQEFALQLMRARDGKIRGLRRHGILQKISSDLVFAAQRTGGYPDSDDESSDSDDDVGQEKDSFANDPVQDSSISKLSKMEITKDPSLSVSAASELRSIPRRRSSAFALKKSFPVVVEHESNHDVQSESTVVENTMHV